MNLNEGRLILSTNSTIPNRINQNPIETEAFERYYERSSMNSKRQRADNWTYEDKELLVECVARYPLVEDRSNEKDVTIKKHNSWKLISDEIILRGKLKDSLIRSPQKVREQWIRLKGKAKTIMKKHRAAIDDGSINSATYKRRPSPIDYRIRELFPHLFETKSDDIDKHLCETTHYIERNDSIGLSSSAPVAQTIEALQNQSHFTAQGDNCSQDYNASTSNHRLSSSEENSYGYPAVKTIPGHQEPVRVDDVILSKPYEETRRSACDKKEKANQIPNDKNRRIIVKRKVPAKLNAFEHILLQANLKKINHAIKQSEELHKLKMVIQRKESYLLDLRIKKAELDIEARMRTEDEHESHNYKQNRSDQNQLSRLNHSHFGSNHHDQIEQNLNNQTERDHNQIHGQIGTNHSHIQTNHPLDHITTNHNHLERNQINSNHNILESSRIRSNRGHLEQNHNQINSNHSVLESNQIGSNRGHLEQNHNQIGSNQRQIHSNHNHIEQNLVEARRIRSNHMHLENHNQIVTNQGQVGSNSSHIPINQNHLVSIQNHATPIQLRIL